MVIERQLSVSPPSFPKLAMVENIALMELLFSFSKPCNLWFRLQIQLCRLTSWHSYRIFIRDRQGRWNGWRWSRRLIEFSLHKNGCGGRNNYGNNSNFSSSPSPYTFILVICQALRNAKTIVKSLGNVFVFCKSDCNYVIF